MGSESWGPDLTEPVFLQEEETFSPCAHRKGHMVSRKGGCLQTRKRGLNGMEFSGILILDFLPPEPCENNFLVCKLPICGVLLW